MTHFIMYNCITTHMKRHATD